MSRVACLAVFLALAAIVLVSAEPSPSYGYVYDNTLIIKWFKNSSIYASFSNSSMYYN